MLFSDGFPDQVGDIDDQIGSGLAGTTGCASLASAHTDDVVQPGMGLAVGQVEQGPTSWRRSGRLARPYPCSSTMIMAPSSASMKAREGPSAPSAVKASSSAGWPSLPPGDSR
jgi:hypothetical protein